MTKHTLLIGSLLVLAASSQAVVIYNTISTTAGTSFTGSTPRHHVADDFSTLVPTATQDYIVNSILFRPIMVADRTYNNVSARVRVFENYAPSTTNVFSGLVSDVTWTFGNLNGTATGAEFLNATLDYKAANARFQLNSGQNMGIAIQMFENGVATNDLTVGLSVLAGAVPPPLVGTTTDGWFRDADNNGIFTNSDGRFFGGTWSSMALTIDADVVPEPATLAALGLGTLALLRRKKKA